MLFIEVPQLFFKAPLEKLAYAKQNYKHKSQAYALWCRWQLLEHLGLNE